MKKDRIYLKHILDAIGKVSQYVSPPRPWRRIAGLRDVLIHDYMGVDLEAVWEVTQRNLPELEAKIRDILTELEQADV